MTIPIAAQIDAVEHEMRSTPNTDHFKALRAAANTLRESGAIIATLSESRSVERELRLSAEADAAALRGSTQMSGPKWPTSPLRSGPNAVSQDSFTTLESLGIEFTEKPGFVPIPTDSELAQAYSQGYQDGQKSMAPRQVWVGHAASRVLLEELAETLRYAERAILTENDDEDALGRVRSALAKIGEKPTERFLNACPK